MGAITTAKRVVEVASERNVTVLAASVAYYAFVSLLPLALLTLVVGSLVGGEQFAAFVVGRVENALSSSGEEVVSRALTNSRGRVGASVGGVAVLAWSGLRLFRGLDLAFAEAYDADDDPSLLRQFVDAAVTLALLAAMGALAVGVVYAVRLSAVGDAVPAPRVVGALALFGALVAGSLPLYYVMPPTDVSVREVLPGAAFAAVGWLMLHLLFQMYVANAGRYQAYGVLGAVVLLVTWLYLAGIVLLTGAILNAVRAGWHPRVS